MFNMLGLLNMLRGNKMNDNMQQNFNNQPQQSFQQSPFPTYQPQNNFSQPPQNNQSNQNNQGPYPYGQFPIHHTKQGQDFIKEQNKAKQNAQFMGGSQNLYPNQQMQQNFSQPQQMQEQNYYNQYQQPQQQQQFFSQQNQMQNSFAPFLNGYSNNNIQAQNFNPANTQSQSGMDLNTLLPLLKGNSGGGNNNQSNLINQILPALSGNNGGSNQNNLISQLLPALSGGNNNMQDLLKMFLNKGGNVKKSESTKNIDSFTKIDD